MSGVELRVDLAAYRKNLAHVSTVVAPAEVMAVLKADAYGHGLVPMARAAVAAGIRSVGALDVATGLTLRASGITEDVLILAWLLSPDEDFAAGVAAGIDLGVSTIEQLDGIADAATTGRARIHLKIDTGLHRNGASAADWPALVERAVKLELQGAVELVGVWTHIAEASEAEDSDSIRRFHEAIGVAQTLGAAFELRHLAASAASFARADARFDLVRVGAFGYGIAPGDGVTPASLGLVPVMTLSAPVSSVSEGVARVGIGYSDGISTASARAVSVAIAGARHPVVAVGVDELLVDIGDAVVVDGSRAVLFGDGSSGEQTLQEWADATGTIGEEIVTRLSRKLPRTYVG